MGFKIFGHKTNANTVLAGVGLALIFWVLLFFIRTINTSNREIENLDSLLDGTRGMLLDMAVDPASVSAPVRLTDALERVGSNRALRNLIRTISDEKLAAAVGSVADFSTTAETNRKISYITEQVHIYKLAQFESMTELFFLFVLLVILSIIVSALAYTDNQKKLLEKEKQTELNRKLNEMLEAERNIISLELHDELAQKLSVIKHHFYAPETRSEHPDILRKYISDCIDTVRQLSSRLKSPVFDRYSLQEQLLVLFSDFSGSSPVKLTYQLTGLTSLDLDDTEKLHLYRIVQELLSNCRKHSLARTASIKILYSHPVVSITYADDGVGYDPDAVTRGLGLNGIRFRLGLLGGYLQDGSKSGAGASIRIGVNQ